MNKDFINVTPDSGTGDATITVNASANSTTSSRSSSIKVSTDGIERTVGISQAAGGTTVTITSKAQIMGAWTFAIVTASVAVDTDITVTGAATLPAGTSYPFTATIPKGKTQSENKTPSDGGIINSPVPNFTTKITGVSPTQSSTQYYRY